MRSRAAGGAAREATRARARATRRPEPDTNTYADTTLAQGLLGTAGGSETRTSRAMNDEQILDVRKRDAIASADSHGARVLM
jgi:hypothetical protein